MLNYFITVRGIGIEDADHGLLEQNPSREGKSRGLNFWVKGDGSKKQLNNKKGIQDFHYIMVFFYWKIHQEICFAVAFKVNE